MASLWANCRDLNCGGNGLADIHSGESAVVVAELAPSAHPARSTTASEATILCIEQVRDIGGRDTQPACETFRARVPRSAPIKKKLGRNVRLQAPNDSQVAPPHYSFWTAEPSLVLKGLAARWMNFSAHCSTPRQFPPRRTVESSGDVSSRMQTMGEEQCRESGSPPDMTRV
jgi:hypothetical protein